MLVYRGTEAGDGGEGRVPRIACGETDEIVMQIEGDLAREDRGRCLEKVVGSDEIVPKLEMGDDGIDELLRDTHCAVKRWAMRGTC